MTTGAAPIRGLAGRRFSIAVQLLIGVAAAAASVPAAAQEAPLANPPELTVLRGPAAPASMTTMRSGGAGRARRQRSAARARCYLWLLPDLECLDQALRRCALALL